MLEKHVVALFGIYSEFAEVLPTLVEVIDSPFYKQTYEGVAISQADAKALLSFYTQNHRPLPTKIIGLSHRVGCTTTQHVASR